MGGCKMIMKLHNFVVGSAMAKIFFQSSSWHSRSFDSCCTSNVVLPYPKEQHSLVLYMKGIFVQKMLYSLACYHRYMIITMDNISISINLFLLLTGIIFAGEWLFKLKRTMLLYISHHNQQNKYELHCCHCQADLQ